MFRRSRAMFAMAVAAGVAVVASGCGSSTSVGLPSSVGLAPSTASPTQSAGVASPPAGPASSGSATTGSASTSTAATGSASTSTASPNPEPTSPLPVSGSSAEPATGTVILVTHDSFEVDKKTLQNFEDSSGLQVVVETQGDAGALVNKLVLTKNDPLGDAFFGIDNTFSSRALAAGILAPYTSPAAGQGSSAFSTGDNRLTPVDYGDVCVNADHQYFSDHHLVEPTTFEDLADPKYKNLLVVESPATSSPGLAFLLGSIAHFGTDKWTGYWTSLKNNGVKVVAGWEDAYTVDFSGSSGHGDRPLVVSYASSPPDEVHDGVAQTGALLSTCFRQIEYAGVLAGAKNPAGAQELVDFLLSQPFQSQVAEQMYVYPVDKQAGVPADWTKFAPLAPHPASLPAGDIAAHRDGWISQWTDLLQG